MDKSNYNNVTILATNDTQKQKVKLLLAEISEDTIEVPDPYYGGDEGFENVYQLIAKACEVIATKLS